MLCTSLAQKQVLLDLDAMKAIIEMLKSDKPALVNCCIRTVAEVTKGCSREIAQQIQNYCSVKYIVELANSDSIKVRHPALLSLTTLAHHAHVRVCIGIGLGGGGGGYSLIWAIEVCAAPKGRVFQPFWS